MIAIILISIYAISAALVYLWVRLAYYHKRGIENTESVSSMWLLLTFCPLINSLTVFVCWGGFYPLGRIDGHTDFFKPRK